MLFKGSGVALITPFENGNINFDLLSDLIEFQINNGTDAIISCGTTGEASTLIDDDHIECLRFTVEKVNKRIPVIAGTGSNDTKHAISLSKAAKAVGVDGLLVTTPYYNKTTQKGLIENYKAIANSVDDLPIILYNVPSRTGLNILPSTTYELSKIKNIIGIKEASGNISQVAEIAALCGPDFDIYSGNDDQTVPVLSLGGKGVISVAANILPSDMHNMCQKYFDGDVKGSLELQLKMLDLMKNLFIEVNPIPVKKALELMGYNVGRCRMPLTTMEDENIKKLAKSMFSYGIKLDKASRDIYFKIDFEDIQKLDPRTIQCVVRNAKDDVLGLALIGASENVYKAIISNLSKNRASSLKEELDFLKKNPVDIETIKRAQQYITDIIDRLAKAGEIVLFNTPQMKSIDPSKIL